MPYQVVLIKSSLLLPWYTRTVWPAIENHDEAHSQMSNYLERERAQIGDDFWSHKRAKWPLAAARPNATTDGVIDMIHPPEAEGWIQTWGFKHERSWAKIVEVEGCGEEAEIKIIERQKPLSK